MKNMNPSRRDASKDSYVAINENTRRIIEVLLKSSKKDLKELKKLLLQRIILEEKKVQVAIKIKRENSYWYHSGKSSIIDEIFQEIVRNEGKK